MADFSTLIQEWYRLNKRDLPWRRHKTAYQIWISEIILQQTQVKQGLSYYLKFVAKYPSVNDLANAHQDDVLKLWQGLGYYSRARNMHFAAKQVVDSFNGTFPSTYKDLISLKGVGEYTASAVSSIAYNLPHAVVDGNVFRVLGRCFLIDNPINSGPGKKIFSKLANELLDISNPGNHNQAVMEIGAMVCKPKNPDCENCPIQSKCLAFSNQTMLNYPVKLKTVKVKNRYLNYFIVTDKKNVIIKQRGKGDIWEGLFDFRLIESKDQNADFIDSVMDVKLKHILTHQHLFATFWIKEVDQIELLSDEVSVKLTDLETYALPQLIVKYLKLSNYFNQS